RYINAVKALNSGGIPTQYGQFVAIHGEMGHHMHTGMGGGPVGRERFLPWHRDFLIKFEQSLQTVDPQAFIPYWHWSVDRKVPKWLSKFKPTVNVPPTSMSGPQTVKVTRSAHHSVALPTAAQINSLDANAGLDYTQFTSLLENFHNIVHAWVGGTMNDI